MSLKRGRVLLSISFSYDERVNVQRWVVSSVQRPPRRRWKLGPNTAPVRVYLRTGAGDRALGQRRSFDLSDWPRGCEYATTERAAWRKAVPLIEQSIALYVELHEEFTTEDNAKGVEECRAALRMLRGNLTRARRHAV